MELRHLHYFLAVAETQHFGQAAERLHMAQSPLSQAIRQLEAEIGARLFDRTTRRVELTPAGAALLTDARRILDAVDTARTRVALVGNGSTGMLRVGSTGLSAFRHLPRLARIAARELSGLELRFSPDLLTPAQEDALENGRIDLAVLRPPMRSAELSARLISRERLVVALSAEHPLAGRAELRLADLRDEDFVAYSAPGSVVNAVVSQACLAAGFLPRRAAEAADASILLTQVAAGLGVAVLPESVLALRVEGVRYVPVTDDVHVDLALAWRTDDDSPALQRLLAALETHGFLSPDEDLLAAPASDPIALGGAS